MAGTLVRIMRKKPRVPVWYAKEWLTHKGLRQTDIVARTEIPKGMVSSYLSGKRRWNQDILAAFAMAIGVDAADLLRSPLAVENELAQYVLKMDEARRERALKVLKALAS